MQIVCIMVQLMPLHPKTPSSLASFKSSLVLPFWYLLTQVVLEKRPLNECIVVLVLTSFLAIFYNKSTSMHAVVLYVIFNAS